MNTTAISSTSNPYAALDGSTSSTDSTNDTASADRFLKLLVTQMKNQDPLNPMDNAQVTSQMAQINTVSGIQQLNKTVSGLNTQFMQMQAMQGASLVGHDVLVAGNSLSVTDGVGSGTFDLDGPADRVKVDVLGPAGQIVDTLDLGAETSGRHTFDWKKDGLTQDAGLHFRVTATQGAAPVAATALMRDRVQSVGIDGDKLTLQLQQSGSVPYSQVKAFD
ncbi:MAG TPA: flagellar hook capping FlgD N-terminal domain-containing protein [Burkholderiaceae bacterium]|nr:flagellar hook capping FlgD N-terminal domain-containing protein [Burkholderiaceae bacterium]